MNCGTGLAGGLKPTSSMPDFNECALPLPCEARRPRLAAEAA
ncbi:MAG TPA: hypothetical protein VGN42_13635 [Pirellulales bacterium]|nr:hypothetical protein [Pirellulales bacterium]